MELKKIYVVSQWSLFSLPPKIETRYIKRETEKTISVCTNPDGSGWGNTIRKSEMSVYDKYFCYTHADAIKKLQELTEKKITSNNSYIESLQKENVKLGELLANIICGKYDENEQRK